MKQRALVTGAAGSIGTAVVAELVDRGFAVDAWDVAMPPQLPGSVPAVVDLTTPVDQYKLRDWRVVAHLASVTENRDDRSMLTDHLRTVAMTAHLLDALVASPPGVVVTTSSQLVYAPGEQTPGEHAAVSASTGFAAAKLSSEAFLQAFGQRTEVPTLVHRLANVVGAATRRGVVHDFVGRAAATPPGGRVEIHGATHHRRSFLSLADCASALVHHALQAPPGHRVANVANSDSVSIADVAEVVSEVTGVPFELEQGSDRLTWRGDLGTVLPSIEQLASTGWRPRSSSRDAVRQAAAGVWDAHHS